MTNAHVRNNLDGPLLVPFAGQMVEFKPGTNRIDQATLDKITGGLTGAGKARGGVAAVYFNGSRPKLQVAGPPIGDDPFHVVEVRTGVKKDRRSRRVAAERNKVAALEVQIAELKALVGQVPPVEIAEPAAAEPPLLDPAEHKLGALPHALLGLTKPELAEVLALEIAGKNRSGAIDIIMDAIKSA